MIPSAVLRVSRLPDITQKTACSQMKANVHRYVLNTNSPLYDIEEPRYWQNNMRY